MNTGVYIVCIFYLFVFPLHSSANVRKSSEQVSAASLQLAIINYVKSEKSEPQSWHDLETSKGSTIIVRNIQKHTPEFKNKYKFIKGGIKIQISVGYGANRNATIIAMGNSPSEKIPTSTSKVETRILILRNGAGDYSVGQYSEVGLARVFREAGIDLADFTGPDGKWQPEPVDSSPKVDLDVLPDGHRVPDDDGIGNMPEGEQRDGVTAASDDGDGISDTYRLRLIVGLLIGLPILAFLVWQSVAAIRKKKQK
jgi:hypothetical protein